MQKATKHMYVYKTLPTQVHLRRKCFVWGGGGHTCMCTVYNRIILRGSIFMNFTINRVAISVCDMVCHQLAVSRKFLPNCTSGTYCAGSNYVI